MSSRLDYERRIAASGARRIAGVDEAGRGPLAGPVVAAAAILPLDWIQNGLPATLLDLNDSKQLSSGQRETFFAILTADPAISWRVAISTAEEIDRINILQATHAAMRRALAALDSDPDHVLVDGLPVRSITLPQTAIPKGDALSYSIAAASVIAKVTRDRLMMEFDAQYRGYGFAEHKGYGTPQHLAAIRELGPCPIHRKSFAPIKPVQSEFGF